MAATLVGLMQNGTKAASRMPPREDPAELDRVQLEIRAAVTAIAADAHADADFG